MSGTHARPALDGWLVKVDQVIADARPASLSPSTAAPWDDRKTAQATTLAGLEAGLEGLLSRLAFGPGRWVLIIEDDRGRYLQVLAYEDGSVLAEVVSNTYLSGDERWSEAEEERLVNLGWGVPEPPRRPNWWEAFPTVSPDIAEASTLLLTTLQAVFGLNEADSVRLAMFCSPRRGATAATHPWGSGDEVPVADELAGHLAGEGWQDATWVGELRRLVVTALERHWAVPAALQDGAWVDELRRLLLLEVRAVYGEDWWATNESHVNEWWESVPLCMARMVALARGVSITEVTRGSVPEVTRRN
jgi:hypothetical protein